MLLLLDIWQYLSPCTNWWRWPKWAKVPPTDHRRPPTRARNSPRLAKSSTRPSTVTNNKDTVPHKNTFIITYQLPVSLEEFLLPQQNHGYCRIIKSIKFSFSLKKNSIKYYWNSWWWWKRKIFDLNLIGISWKFVEGESYLKNSSPCPTFTSCLSYGPGYGCPCLVRQSLICCVGCWV